MASLIKANPMAVLSRQASQSQPMAALSKPMAVLSRLAIFEQGCGGAWKGRPLDFSFEGNLSTAGHCCFIKARLNNASLSKPMAAL